jgi:hypothetical protein
MRLLPAGAGGFGREWMSPRRAGLLCAVVVGGALLAIGLVALLASGPSGALPADQLPSAGDGPVHVMGTVALTWVDGGSSSTHLTLQGAAGVVVRAPGAPPAPFGPGDFVEVTGTMEGGTLTAHSIRQTVDPVDRAAPWLGLAAVLLSAAFAVPMATGARAVARRIAGGVGAARGRLRRGPGAPQGGAPPPAQ